MEIVTIEKEEIRLCSCMEEESFGKTNYDSIVTQEGIIAECDFYKEGEYHFTFTPWRFSEIRALQNKNDDKYLVYYCGKNPLSENAQSLLNFFENAGKATSTKDEKDKMFEASFIICSILTQAAKEKLPVPINGAGGIIIDLNSDKTKILFLPQNLYKYSASGIDSVESANLHGCWVNQTLLGLPAICFARAVIAYKMLTGRFPYSASNPTERNADILDKKFLPLELSVNGIAPELASEVNKALKLTSNEVTIPGKKKKGKSSEDLTPTEDFPLQLLYSSKKTLNKTKLSDEDFDEKAKTFIKSQESKIKTKRTIRRNKGVIAVSIIGFITLIIIIICFIKNSRENYTSKGLTSTETIETYYKAINDKDTVLMDNMTKGKQPGRYVDTLSQIYVVGKSRQAYAHDMGIVTPENWLIYATDAEKDKRAGVYGITNVLIDGTLSELTPKMITRGENPVPLTEEKGVALTNNTKSIHNVQYFLIHSEGENNEFFVEKVFETITLTFVKNQWLITNIETETVDTNFNNFTFKQDYFKTIAQNEGDVLKTIEQLREKYYWFPSKNTILREKKRLDDIATDPFHGVLN